MNRNKKLKNKKLFLTYLNLPNIPNVEYLLLEALQNTMFDNNITIIYYIINIKTIDNDLATAYVYLQLDQYFRKNERVLDVKLGSKVYPNYFESVRNVRKTMRYLLNKKSFITNINNK